MKSAICLKVFCGGAFVLALYGYAGPGSPVIQIPDSTRDNAGEGDLSGTRWDGSIDWTEKGRFRGQRIDVPYTVKVRFTFSADGTCTNNKAQPCRWEKKGQTIT